MRANLALIVILTASLVACDSSKKTVSGTIRILPELQTKISSTAVLYVIARPSGQLSGPPVAVKRYVPPFQFPLAFQLSQEDAMIPDMPFKGELTISARISQSGSAMPAASGDLDSSQGPRQVKVGESGFEMILDRRQN